MENFENNMPVEGNGGEVTPFILPLTRQPSIYSLTFDEFQNTVGGIGKDFGSMNMDEFLKNLWSAEENHNIGSLTIPRTLSVKTVDEVWQDLLNEYDSTGGCSGSAQRQPTLGEITLEDFLAKAGVVRDNWDFGTEDQQEKVNGDLNTINVNLPLDISFGGQQEPLQLQKQIPSPTVMTSNGITSQKMKNTGGIQSIGNNGVSFSTGLPSVSPTPYMFSGLRGRKMAGVEKVLERRQRRMIKNRESAARSRARKQAYTRELEEEVAKLKEENQKLQKKQAGIRAMQKNLIREMTNQRSNGGACLRRMNTGPW